MHIDNLSGCDRYHQTAGNHIPLSNSHYRPVLQPIDPATIAIEARPFGALLDQARAGDMAARAELRLRGNSTVRAIK